MIEGTAKAGASWGRFKFTWTGLIVLLALVGVVAAVAYPSYGDYTNRAQASEAISLISGAKTPLAEYFEDRKKWPTRLEEVFGITSGKYTQSVMITRGAGGTGEIEVTATMRADSVVRSLRGKSILMLSSDGGKNWICKPGTMEPKNLPAACRN